MATLRFCLEDSIADGDDIKVYWRSFTYITAERTPPCSGVDQLTFADCRLAYCAGHEVPAA
jgi:hypothetical protein